MPSPTDSKNACRELAVEPEEESKPALACVLYNRVDAATMGIGDREAFATAQTATHGRIKLKDLLAAVFREKQITEALRDCTEIDIRGWGRVLRDVYGSKR
jgi:hypothetical protein